MTLFDTPIRRRLRYEYQKTVIFALAVIIVVLAAGLVVTLAAVSR